MRFASAIVLALTARLLSAQDQPKTVTQLLDERIRSGSAAAEVVQLYLAERLASPSVAVSTPAAMVAALNNQRTDIQIGGNSNAPAATTLLQRPGIADLLSVALERGAIDQSRDGDAVTLSTTPYALFGFIGARDTPQNWEAYSGLRRVAVSATFSDDVSQTGDFNSIDSGEVKIVLWGNRSPRDAVLLRAFKPIAAEIGDADRVKRAACQPVIGLVTDAVFTQAITRVSQLQMANQGGSTRSELDSILVSVTVDNAGRQAIAACAGTIVAAEHTADTTMIKLGAATAAYLAAAEKNQLSLSFSAHRDATVSDYGTLKLLWARHSMPKLTFNVNAEANINQDNEERSTPDAKINRIRSYALEAGATFGRFNGNRFDATGSLKLWRDNGAEAKDTAVFQLHSTVYVTSAISVPVALTYATRPVENIQEGWQINFGVGSLLDSVLSQRVTPSP